MPWSPSLSPKSSVCMMTSFRSDDKSTRIMLSFFIFFVDLFLLFCCLNSRVVVLTEQGLHSRRQDNEPAIIPATSGSAESPCITTLESGPHAGRAPAAMSCQTEGKGRLFRRGRYSAALVPVYGQCICLHLVFFVLWTDESWPRENTSLFCFLHDRVSSFLQEYSADFGAHRV